MPRFTKGEEVTFVAARTGRRFAAKVVDPTITRRKVLVTIIGDPYPVHANVAQVLKKGEGEVPTGNRVQETRKLAKQAKLLGIKGHAKMSAAELRAAVANHGKTVKKAPARKATPARATSPRKARPAVKPAAKRVATKVAKTTAKRTTAKRASKLTTPRTSRATTANGNPFRPGCNAFKMADELIRGGKRSDMVKRLKRSMKIRPWSKDEEEEPEKAIVKRLGLVSAELRDRFGFKIDVEGRGESAIVHAYPPGAKKAVAKRATKVASSKPTTRKRAR